MLKLGSILILFFISEAFISAQEMNTKLIDPCLDAKGNAYMDRQDAAFLKEINDVLTQYPPSYPAASERKGALYLLDAVLHDKYAAFRKPVQRFYRTRLENTLSEIENTKVSEGAIIWKLYNMGFIVRTKSVTLAFDLVRGSTAGSKDFELSDETMKRFVEQCDVLFISHKHSDHIDKGVAQEFIDNGKPVVAATQLWKNDPIFEKITHLKREADTKQTLPIQNGKIYLDVVTYPGHQMSGTLNNVPLVFTPEGITVSHMGDQINEGDFMVDYDWIDNVAKKYQVDILLPPCWTNELYRIVKGFDPKLVIPGHENELGHPVDDRVPFWGDTEYLELTNDDLYRSDYHVIQMTWGESFHYIPVKK
ncbi:hypothetical protein MNBD_IGNAVI01-1969 [hydrothermal vent metagenome]|uniref:Metallo-beta-lactamase domain-containing protein n=1 Tax=hydrothermal vent metagenome TaxID=652676 RepID=A0A3B1C2I2_9ZZZZ